MGDREWNGGGQTRNTARGYEDTTTTITMTSEQHLDRTPIVRLSSLGVMSALPSLVCPAATSQEVTHPIQGITSHLEISCMQNLQRHDSIPAPADETPDVMRVLGAEGSRGAGGAGGGFYILIWPV